MRYSPSRRHLKVARFESLVRFVFVRAFLIAGFFAFQGVSFVKILLRIARENPEYFEEFSFLSYLQPICAWASFLLSFAILVFGLVCRRRRVFLGLDTKKEYAYIKPLYALSLALFVAVLVQLAWTSFVYFGYFFLFLSLVYLYEVLTITPALLALFGLSLYSLIRLHSAKKTLQKSSAAAAKIPKDLPREAAQTV